MLILSPDARAIYQKQIQELYGNETSQSNSALACHEFANVIKPNDIVIAKKGTKGLLGYGKVTGGYLYDTTQSEYHHIRKIKDYANIRGCSNNDSNQE